MSTQPDSTPAAHLDRKRSRRSLHGVVVCVRSRDGWCALLDQRKTTYRDSVETRCGMVVTLPLGIERREPDCTECKKADNDKLRHSAPAEDSDNTKNI